MVYPKDFPMEMASSSIGIPYIFRHTSTIRESYCTMLILVDIDTSLIKIIKQH